MGSDCISSDHCLSFCFINETIVFADKNEWNGEANF